ncbi:hypothetical protein [Pseudomonas sp. F3-2]|uniref:hypothetical protein n=1 Tax=Pseudomonas sp. F3-2 TaxID=3141539 RepID=UPI00315CE445
MSIKRDNDIVPTSSTKTTMLTGNHVVTTSAQIIGEIVPKRKTDMANTPKAPQDARSDQKNPNRGTPGTNVIWDKAQGNRGKQLNPNQGGRKGS